MHENEIGRDVVDALIAEHRELGPGLLEIELKSVERITNIHKKQLLTYLRLMSMRPGYLLNFGEEIMKNGIIRTVNGLNE